MRRDSSPDFVAPLGRETGVPPLEALVAVVDEDVVEGVHRLVEGLIDIPGVGGIDEERAEALAREQHGPEQRVEEHDQLGAEQLEVHQLPAGYRRGEEERHFRRRKGEHPSLGTVTLGQLLSAWTVHDLGHIAQTSRVIAKQYRDAVGPWRAFLPVVDLPG